MSNKKKNIKTFGWARAFVVFWLGILGVGYLPNVTLLGILFILAMLYVIFMDVINEKLFERSKEDENTEKPAEVKYDPKAHGKPIKCPYCKKSIPADINYCYYCGKSLEDVRRIEEMRLYNLEKLDSAAAGIQEGEPKENVEKIRDLTDKIFKKYREKPDSISNSDKFTDYYLPKTISAIEHYKNLSGLEDLDPDGAKVKGELEDSLSMIREAFSNILNRLSTEGIYDISADVRVLETLLMQEGLTDSDFQIDQDDNNAKATDERS